MDKDRYDSKWITSRDATASGNTQNFCYPFPRPKYLFLSVGTQFPENLRPASVATFALTQGGGYGGRPPLPPSASAISIPSASRRRKLSFFREASYSVGLLHAWHIRSAHFHIENVLFSNSFAGRFFFFHERMKRMDSESRTRFLSPTSTTGKMFDKARMLHFMTSRV